MAMIQHMAFVCRDLKKQEAFYTKHFGFRRARTFNKGTADEFVMLRVGSACLEFFQASGAAKQARGGEQAIGFRHLAFEVPDLDKAVAALKADGVAVGDIIDCSGIVPKMRVCFFDDPDGNKLELMQGYRDE